MTEDATSGSKRRFLTAGSPGFVWLYAFLCFTGSVILTSLFLDPGEGPYWLFLVSGVVFAIPLYFLLRIGDRLAHLWWEGRTPGTRRILAQAGYWSVALVLGGIGIWQIAMASATESRSPTKVPADILLGLLFLAGAVCSVCLAAAQVKRREKK